MISSSAIVSGGRVVLQTISDLGGRVLFNLPGRGVYRLLDELPNVPDLRYVGGLHEFAVATMADGYARATGGPAFLNLYMSTGTLNAASALFLAQRDRVPLVVTATQTETFAAGSGSRAEVQDIVAMMRSLTKWSWQVPTPDRLREALIRATTIAMTPPMGPVFLAIPADFFDALVTLSGEAPDLNTSARGGAPELNGSSWFCEADLPVLIVGGEAVAAGAHLPALRLAEAVGAVVLAEPDPPSLPAPSEHPLYGGTVDDAADLLSRADLVVHVGVNTYETWHGDVLRAGQPKRHLWIGTDEAELHRVVVADSYVLGNLLAATQQLAASISPPSNRDRRSRLVAEVAKERLRWKADAADGWDESPLSAARLFAELRRALPENTVVVDQCTTTAPYLRAHFPVPAGDLYVAASGSSQGWAAGAALGVKLADPGRPVMAVVGDGGLMFGVQALWSAVEHQIPVVFVVCNNGGWHSMRTSLARLSPQVAGSGTELGFGWEMDYAGLAESMGMRAITVDSPASLRAFLSEDSLLDQPILINAICRRERRVSGWMAAGLNDVPSSPGTQ